jgi:hypothetical protein
MQDVEQVVAGWVLTGLVYVAAGLWALLHLPGPLRLLGGLLVVHGTQGVRLGRRLSLGRDDPWQRRSLAKALALDAALLAATVVLFRG